MASEIDRAQLDEVCARHGVSLNHIERLLGAPVDESTRRAAWELIKSESLRRKLLPFTMRLRKTFSEAKILQVNKLSTD